MEQQGSSLQRAFEALLARYTRYFDIERDAEFAGEHVDAIAQFHSRGERYVLTKRAKLWAAESHEYVLVFCLQTLDDAALARIKTLLEQAQQAWVQPHDEHMYTYVTAVVLAEDASEEAVRRLRRFKLRRSYRLSLHGWSHGRLALLTLPDGRIASNADGREVRTMLRGIAKRLAKTG